MFWGIIAIISSVSTILISLYSNPGFDFQNEALSYMGTVNQSALVFNLGLILSGIFMLLFSYFLTNKLKLSIIKKKILFFFLVFSSLSLIVVGLFPYNINILVHMAGAIGLFLGFILTILVFGLFYLKKGFWGIGSIIIAIIYIVGFFILTNKFEGLAIAETFLGCLIIIWIIAIFLGQKRLFSK